MKDLIIVGTGVHAAEMAEMVERINQVSPTWNLLGYLTINEERIGQSYNGYPILGGPSSIDDYLDAFLVPDNEWPDKQKLPIRRVVSLIDPTVIISRTARIGAGCVIYPNSYIGLNAALGDYVFCLTAAIINHDCRVADKVAITTGVTLAGSVQIGEGCYLGQSCSIRQFIKVGANSLVGMGSVVVKDVPANSVVVGNPARTIKENR